MPLTGLVAADRACLHIAGADARDVLQSVITNDIERLRPGAALYAALLTPQGKYLFDFILIDRGGEGVILDVAADRAQALAGRLKMYCLRRDARIAPEPGLGVALAWPGAGNAHPPTPSPPPGQAATIVADPRSGALGWRIYAPDPEAALDALGAARGDSEDYRALRVANRVPESGIELVPEETFILEADFERLDGVDFKKGCYVGQEVTARMKHKSALKKRLVAVTVEGAAEPGTPVTTAEGKPAGRLFSQAGGRGLAHLRLDRAGGPLSAGAARLHWSESPEMP